MTIRLASCAVPTLTLALVLSFGATLRGQGRTDIVTLANGDRITGEVVRLDRGRLEFKTDDAGTLYLEWDKLVSVITKRRVEVVTTDGRRFLGSLGQAPDRAITVVGPAEATTLQTPEVTYIRTIEATFWTKLDGSIDAGYSYSRSSGVSQLNLNTNTVHRNPGSQMGLSISATQTRKDDGSGRDDRASLDASYLRYQWQRWFFGIAGRFETNESLGLELRSQIGGVVGPRLVNSNRAQMVVGAGVAVNDERGVDVESTRNVEALFVFRSSFYTYDRPKTNIDVGADYYPSLSNPGRNRLQLDAGIKYELWKDFYVAFNVYNTYDSRPPNPAADTNDFGVVASVGWSY
ncbi:MAG TPA: DUF481 domain-containing protein [Vicinamibacterales bacterium]|jgi:hypothetical protein